MKKIISNPIFTFILGALICGTTGVVASTLMAGNIAYTPKDSTWGVNNVEAAIDSLKLSKTSDNYSTDEKVVGTWIDGKPLYQKTYTIASMSKDGHVDVDTDIEYAFVVAKTYRRSKNGIDVDDYWYNTGDYANVRATVQDNHTLRIVNCTSNSTLTDVVITIQYTKTTDQANN